MARPAHFSGGRPRTAGGRRDAAVRRRPKAERVREILEAARAVFSEHGYERASITEIARRAGVVEGTIYKHFESKRDLLYRVMAEFYEGLIRDVESGVRGIRGAADRLRFIVGRHLRAFVADRGLCRLFIREIRPDSELYLSQVADLNRRYTQAAVDALQAGIDSGELRADLSPAMVRHMIYGAIEHVVWRALFAGGDIDVDRTAEDLTSTLLHGIAGASSAKERKVASLEARLAGLERRLEGMSPATALPEAARRARR